MYVTPAQSSNTAQFTLFIRCSVYAPNTGSVSLSHILVSVPPDMLLKLKAVQAVRPVPNSDAYIRDVLSSPKCVSHDDCVQ